MKKPMLMPSWLTTSSRAGSDSVRNSANEDLTDPNTLPSTPVLAP